MEPPVVTVQEGQLKGCVRPNIDSGNFFAFLGIPYAKPPVGSLRFKAPVPAEPWNGIRDATHEGSDCFSRNDFTLNLQGAEDCLYLNVYTKNLPQSSKELKPVMVWIHGGGFISGSASPSLYGPELLMTEDIVLVSMNYRLGVLGFLTLDDPSLEVPGNAGLKDQSLALKWVQRNIKNFNGDPNNVTIFGESAGAASVHYHVLSQSSRGCFHKAILQSGTALNYWALGFNVAEEFAKYVGYDVKNEKEALEALKETPVEVLFTNQERFMEEFVSRGRPFSPVIERPNDTAFITKNAIDIITSGEYNAVPMIMGYTTREGMLLDVMYYFKKLSGKKIPESPPPDSEETILSVFNLKNNSSVAQTVYNKIKDVYFKGSDKEDGRRLLNSDAMFIADILAALENHLATMREPIYLYRMSVISQLNFLKNNARLQHLPGVCHADDLGYLFKSFLTPKIEAESLEDVSFRRFVKLWTNFAKYGNPTPDEKVGVIWPPAKQDQINFLDIGSELILGTNPEPERTAVWKELSKLNLKIFNYL